MKMIGVPRSIVELDRLETADECRLETPPPMERMGNKVDALHRNNRLLQISGSGSASRQAPAAARPRDVPGALLIQRTRSVPGRLHAEDSQYASVDGALVAGGDASDLVARQVLARFPHSNSNRWAGRIVPGARFELIDFPGYARLGRRNLDGRECWIRAKATSLTW